MIANPTEQISWDEEAYTAYRRRMTTIIFSNSCIFDDSIDPVSTDTLDSPEGTGLASLLGYLASDVVFHHFCT